MNKVYNRHRPLAKKEQSNTHDLIDRILEGFLLNFILIVNHLAGDECL